jgi:hypothetical protein
VFNSALAVRYRLVAAAGKATRRDRCIASGLAAYDDRRSRDRRVPKRPRWARAVRSACTTLDRRHELRVDGEPRAAAAYDRLMDRYLRP